MSFENFTIGENRTRPPYLPKTIRCSSCNAPVSLYSEKSQLVVCESCGENLDCSKEELVALGKPDDTHSNFGMKLHQKFTWENITYKVIARMRFLDRWGDITDEFLLFHPFQGTKWFSIYKGEDGREFSLSEEKHSLALEDPFQMGNNKRIKTGDRTVWIKESESEMILQYVDGALPWLAKVGDRTQAIEYLKAGDKRCFLTAEKTNLGSFEIEYSYSRKLVGSQFLNALGGKNSTGFQNNKHINKPEVDANQVKIIIYIIIMMMILFFFLGCLSSCFSCVGGGGGYSSGRTHYGGGLGGGK